MNIIIDYLLHLIMIHTMENRDQRQDGRKEQDRSIDGLWEMEGWGKRKDIKTEVI